jgi:hypothetical protein
MIGFIDTSITVSLNYSQLQQLTINDCLKTRSSPYWTTSVFSSTVTDLVLIYESVTSSASVVRWLSWTLNSTQLLNSELSYEWRLTYESLRTNYE